MLRFSWTAWFWRNIVRPNGKLSTPRRRPMRSGSVEPLESRTMLSGSSPIIDPNQTFSLLSNSDPGFVVGKVEAHDTEDGQKVTYSISGGNGAFSINASGQIIVADKSKLNALPNQTTVFVTVTDDTAPRLSTSANIPINVNHPPALSNVTFGVLPTISVGGIIGTVTGADSDVTQSISYSIITGNESGAFSLNPTTGTLTVADKGAFDALIFPKSLAIEVHDNGSPQGVGTAIIKVTRNFPPVVNDQSFTVLTTAQVNDVIGTVVVSNVESDQTLTYSLTTGNESGALAIDNTGKLTIANKAAFDALPISPTITVVISDDGAPVGTDSAVISLIFNTPPSIDAQTFQVSSPVSVGTEIGVVLAFDAEMSSGQTLAFKINSGNETGAFAINSQTGRITVANLAAFNSLQLPHPLVVQVQDSSAPPSTRSATITITENHAPVIADQSLIVPAGAQVGTVIGTVIATDSDAAQSLTYSITGGNAAGAFAIDGATGKVTLASQAAFEGLALPVALTVTVRDNGSPQQLASAVITINGNHAPTIANQTLTVPAGAQVGTVIGTVIATDSDVGQSLTYSITGGNVAGAFAIDSASGKVVLVNKVIYDTLTLPQTLTIEVRDNGTPQGKASAPIVIAGNHAPVLNDQTFTVPSPNATTLGATVAELRFTDAEGASQNTSFFLISGNEAGALAIDNSGKITIADKAAFDALIFPRSFVVEIRDSGTPQGIDSAIVTLIRNTTPIIVANQVFPAPTSFANGTVVGTVEAFDAEVPSSQTLNFSFLSGNETGALKIDPATGEITVADPAAFGFLSLPKVLNVQVQDSATPRGTATADITITGNHRPTINDQAFTVSSNIGAGAEIGTIVATDIDNDQTLTYQLTTGNETLAFAITSGNKLVVNNLVAFNGLAFPKALTVEVRDNGTPTGISTATITLTRNNPPVILNQNLNVPLMTPGSGTDTVVAFDVDSQTLTYSIIAGNTGGVFMIDPLTGKVSIASKTAYDNLPLPYDLTVQVQDSGSPSSSASATITILGNHAPVVDDQSFEIPLNATSSTAIGTVQVKDVDTAQSKTFLLIGGAGINAFNIDPQTGVIKLKSDDALASLSLPITLTVQVFDNGSPQKSDTANITLTGIGNHAPVFSATTLTIPETGTSLGTLVATDPDIGQTLTYTIVTDGSGESVALNSQTGALTILNREALVSLAFPVKLLVRVQDSFASPASTTAIVTLVLSPTNAADIIHFDSQTFVIPTTTPQGGVLGTIFAYAKDRPTEPELPTLRYTSNSSQFPIDPVTGVLTSAAALSTAATITIQITATDNSNANLSVTRPVTISVVETKNHLPSAQNLDVLIDENSTARTPVGKVVASPSDAGEKLKFSIVESSVPRAFTIDSKTGDITINDDSLLDYEQHRVIYLRVRITDDGKGLSGTGATNTNPKPLSTFVRVTVRLGNIESEAFRFEFSPGSRTYQVGSEPVRLDPIAIFQDPTTKNFGGVKLNVGISSPTERPKRDVLLVVSDKPGPGNISVIGKSILYDKTVIATFSGGKHKDGDLCITFNSAASASSIQALLRRIGFKTGGPMGERQIDLRFTNSPNIQTRIVSVAK